MAVSDDVLGMNARNYLYIKKYNSRESHEIADNKLLSKEALVIANVITAKPLFVIRNRKAMEKFDWSKLPSTGFALKPARGYGGEGITVFKSWSTNFGETVSGELITVKDLQALIMDILEGVHSLQSLPDVAYFEELISPHPFFKKLTHLGLPDIRVIVFNKVPVMAMIRVPNEKSHGKANLMQGALALGIDLRTGITTSAFTKKGHIPRFLPGTKLKVRGIKVPHWYECLLMSSKAADACGLGFAGVDLVFDEHKGPLVLEVNARPGLSIQMVNMDSLRTRLERIEKLGTITCERGVELAQSLFARDFSEKVNIQPKILGVHEAIVVKQGLEESVHLALVNTTSKYTLIDKSLARKLNLINTDKTIEISGSSGTKEIDAVTLRYTLLGVKFRITAGLMNLKNSEFKIILGRNGIKGFLIDPEKIKSE